MMMMQRVFTVGMFKLSAYNVVGLDFDQTLVQYKLSNLFQFHYFYLTKFLIEKKGYSGLTTEMTPGDIDFIRRGLFMDFKRGNVLDISSNGIIISASHGTRKLNFDEIKKNYGEKMTWSATDRFIKDKLALWEGPTSEETRTFLDYSDATGTLVYAKLIDFIDEHSNEDYSEVWPHLLDAIINMYKSDSDLNKEFLFNISNYIDKCKSEVMDFLNRLRRNSLLILITGSSPQLVKHMATYALGSNWETLFDTIVYSAKKPSFFTQNNPFKNLDGQEIKLLTSKGHYVHGNWPELYSTIENEIKTAPKCVYLGDSTIQDVYAPAVSSKPIDSVSVIDEALADGIFPGECPHADYLKSSFWGPYFGKSDMTTVMGSIIMEYSKLCIPSLSYLAEKPLDFEHLPFWVRNA